MSTPALHPVEAMRRSGRRTRLSTACPSDARIFGDAMDDLHGHSASEHDDPIPRECRPIEPACACRFSRQACRRASRVYTFGGTGQWRVAI